MHDPVHKPRQGNAIIRGARLADGPFESAWYSIRIDSGRVSHVGKNASPLAGSQDTHADIDLTGYLVLPGLVNAHDHLQFALYPRLGNPPYENYLEWGEDIHRSFSDVIATHHSIPKSVRLWWGGLRNLLCGVTTVCHHDLLWPQLQRNDFPVRIVQDFGWCHSVALGGDLAQAHKATPATAPFILHACEGTDALAKLELDELDRLGLLDRNTVLVHGLALNGEAIDLLRGRGGSLIVCPSSNHFLFHRVPAADLLDRIEDLSLGNDSPLTAEGDLLDEIRFAIRQCEIDPGRIYAMVTVNPAKALHLQNQEGTICTGGAGDLIAVLDNGRSPNEALVSLSLHDIELVMIGGCAQLASHTVWHRLPPSTRDGLEPLWIDGTVRWLRAPVDDLLRQAEAVLGEDNVRLGGRPVRSAAALQGRE